MRGAGTGTVDGICGFVDGEWLHGDGAAMSVFDPSDTRELVGRVRSAGTEHAQAATAAAHRAVPGWHRRPLSERVGVLRRVVNALNERADAFAEIISRENGKTLREAHTEVQATVRDARYQLDTIERAPVHAAHGGAAESAVDSEVRREPLGAMLLITPWNFPLATVARKLVPALALGNTVVVKPSELTPLTAARFVELLADHELPAGTVNLVLGDGASVGTALAEDPRIAGISFTGSTDVGVLLARQVASRDVRVQAEMGGKNALVVLADADREAALDAALSAGFGCAGQWCLSTSRLIIEQPLYERFVSDLATRAERLRLGPGLDSRTQMGPMISAAQLDRTAAAVAQGLADGARLVTGGTAVPEIAGAPGHYFRPTVFADVAEDFPLARDEIFGPVVAAMPANDPEHALDLANATAYGLSFSVYTSDEDVADRFVREVRAGVCHVNRPTYYREAHMPLGGWSASGRGTPECGDFALDAFTRVKAVYRA